MGAMRISSAGTITSSKVFFFDILLPAREKYFASLWGYGKDP
jgi:hypothetical protein